MPLATRTAIATSNWALRLFPVLVVLVVAALAVALGLVVALYRNAPSHGAIRLATLGVFLLAAAEVLVSALLVYAVRAAY